MNNRPANTGFSLIELLVVIVIISLLVGISFPVYRSVMKQSQANQTRNVLNALRSIADEHHLKTDWHVDHTDGGTNQNLDRTTAIFLSRVRQIEDCKMMLNSIKIAGDVYYEGADLDKMFVKDAWENKIRYAMAVSHKDNQTWDDSLPQHTSPFFASAGIDGLWGSEDDNATAQEESEASDNIYSFELE